MDDVDAIAPARRDEITDERPRDRLADRVNVIVETESVDPGGEAAAGGIAAARFEDQVEFRAFDYRRQGAGQLTGDPLGAGKMSATEDLGHAHVRPVCCHTSNELSALALTGGIRDAGTAGYECPIARTSADRVHYFQLTCRILGWRRCR